MSNGTKNQENTRIKDYRADALRLARRLLIPAVVLFGLLIVAHEYDKKVSTSKKTTAHTTAQIQQYTPTDTFDYEMVLAGETKTFPVGKDWGIGVRIDPRAKRFSVETIPPDAELNISPNNKPETGWIRGNQWKNFKGFSMRQNSPVRFKTRSEEGVVLIVTVDPIKPTSPSSTSPTKRKTA